jgi:nitroreductase
MTLSKTNIVHELARRRKSVRKFLDSPVEFEAILSSLETACQAPSGANRQPWRFILVKDPDVKRRVRRACEQGEREFYEQVSGEFREWLLSRGLSWEKPFLESAPILVAVLMDQNAPYARESVWIAIGFALLAFEENGLNSFTYTPSNTDYPRKALNAPEDYKLEAILPIGKSADDRMKEGKLRVHEVTFIDRWGNSLDASMEDIGN